MRSKTVKARDIHARHMKSSPAYRKAFDALWSEFALVDALIQAQTRPYLAGESRQPRGHDRKRGVAA